MDLHRCRFVPYPPSAINAIAASHQYPGERTVRHAAIARVAIGRANGDIDIWNPVAGGSAWNQETVLHGAKDRSIDGLVWVTEPDRDYGASGGYVTGKMRLFSIGSTPGVTEWDLEKGRAKSHAAGQHSDIWCLAEQPPLFPPAASDAQPVPKLVGGTVDGELVLYTLEDGQLRFQKLISRTTSSKKTRMVSIAFQNRHTVVVGCSDSTIHVYDMQRGTLLRRMTLGADVHGGAKNIIVWAVKCAADGAIVSGDSTGHVCIWHPKLYTQTQKIRVHDQDVLSLAVGEENSIVSGGMDRRTVLLKKHTGQSQRWAKVWGRKYHNHDVKAMAAMEFSKISVVITGGPDASPVVLPLREHGQECHRTLPSLPQSVPLVSASKARFIVSWWDREIHVWQLRQAFSSLVADSDTPLDENRKLLKTIVVKGEANITSASINQDGSMLVVATTSEIKAFHLQHSNPSQSSDVRVSQVPVMDRISRAGATLVQLSPKGDSLCLVQDRSRVVVLRVAYEDSLPRFCSPQKLVRLPRKIPKHIILGGLGNYERSIKFVVFSPDGKMVAAADLAGYIDTWILRTDHEPRQNGNGQAGETDASSSSSSSSSSSDSSSDSEDAAAYDDVHSGGRWIRNPNVKLHPKLSGAPVALSFSDILPSDNEYNLLAVTAPLDLCLIHPVAGPLAEWKRRNKRLPAKLKDTVGIVKGALWQGSRVWLYGSTFLFMIDISQDIPDEDVERGKGESRGKKRKRIQSESGAGGKMFRGSLGPNRVQKMDTTNGEPTWEDVDMDARAEPSVDDKPNDEGLSDEEEVGDLTLVRRGRGGGDVQTQADAGNEASEIRRSWWITYKYRPIFGIVPLAGSYEGTVSGVVGGEAGREQPLEAALIERPVWDTDMPERYLGPADRT